MVEIKVIREFRDRENELKLRTVGEVYEVSPERARLLIGMNLAALNLPEPEEPEQTAESSELTDIEREMEEPAPESEPEIPKKTKKATKAQ